VQLLQGAREHRRRTDQEARAKADGCVVIAALPIIAMVVGALMYALSSNGKIQELGRILFAAGAFALLFALSGKTVSLLK
jgi:hypothetical protein